MIEVMNVELDPNWSLEKMETEMAKHSIFIRKDNLLRIVNDAINKAYPNAQDIIDY